MPQKVISWISVFIFYSFNSYAFCLKNSIQELYEFLSIQSRNWSTLVYTPGNFESAQYPFAPNETIPITAHLPSSNSELSKGPPESPLQLSLLSSPAQIWVLSIFTPSPIGLYLPSHVGMSTNGTTTCFKREEIGWLFPVLPHPIIVGLLFRLSRGNPLNLFGRQAGRKPSRNVTGFCNLTRAMSFLWVVLSYLKFQITVIC